MRLIIIRHGVTKENLKDIIQGHRDNGLTQQGQDQARKLALKLKDEPIDLIFSSDLKRARYTTQILAKYHNVPIFYSDDLRERAAGIFEGKPVGELQQAIRKSRLSSVEFVPEGGESLQHLKERADRFLRKLIQEHSDKTILLSSHGGWNKMLLAILMNKTIEEARRLPQANACLNIAESRNHSQYDVLIMNDVAHLLSEKVNGPLAFR